MSTPLQSFSRCPEVPRSGTALEELLAATLPPKMLVRLLGITVSNLDRGEDVMDRQMTLPIN